MLNKKLYLNGLGCANCARKIEDRVSSLKYTKEVVLNFSTSMLKYQVDEVNEQKSISEVEAIVKSLEPDVVVEDTAVKKINVKSTINQEDSCSCGHEHNHEHSHSHEHSHEEACGCGSNHHAIHEEVNSSNLDKKNKSILDDKRIVFGFSLVLTILAVAMPVIEPIKAAIFALAIILCGSGVIIKGVKNLFGLNFEENLLMTIAVIAAFFIGEYFEASLVMILFTIGEYIEHIAIEKSRKDISKLSDIRPDTANLVIGNSENNIQIVNAENISIGDTILIKAGERVPLDSEIIKGSTMVDTSAITGESVPVSVSVGDKLLSGTINQSGLIVCKVINSFENSAASRIIDLVEESVEKKGNTEKLITKFARIYTPVVMVMAVLLAIVPPLLGLGEFSQWLKTALIFLVSSCPCAFVIAVPLGFYSAIGASSKIGVLVKGGKYLEILSNAKSVVFDKTGTITSGKLKVSNIVSHNSEYTEDDILRIGAMAESFSNHPIANSVVSHYGKEIDKSQIESYNEKAGMGIECIINNKKYICGSSKMMTDNNIDIDKFEASNIYIAQDNIIIGQIFIQDQIKESSKTIVQDLSNQGVERVVMLTGDNQKAAKSVSGICNIKEYYSGLLPEDKVKHFEKIKSETTSGTSIFVGDGINDAPSLAIADAGVSIGMGSDIAIESSDIVLMSGEISDLPKVISLSKRALMVIKGLIIFALLTKFTVLALSIFGMANIIMAVIADVGVTIVSVLIASRIK